MPVRRILQTILLLLNIVIGIGYLACAYSVYISPEIHPYIACLGLFIPFFIVPNVLFLMFWLVVRWRYLWVSLVALILGWGSLRTYSPINIEKEPKGGRKIKVLTYNVEGFTSENASDILSYLQKSDADIVCLQEAMPQGRLSEQKVEKALASYPYSRKVKTKGGDGLTCFSQFPILSSSPIEYASRFNGSVLYRLQVDGDTLVLVNNHLESNKITAYDKDVYKEIIMSPRKETVKTGGKYLIRKLADAVCVRAVQADSVANVIHRNRTDYMIVCGDFNDSPVSYTHRVVGKGLVDAYAEAGFGPGFSYNQSMLYFRIDHLLVSEKFRVLKCDVDRSIQASDHYPVWCVLEK